MTPEQETQLLTTVTETHTRVKMLVSEDGAHGMVPAVTKRVDAHDRQISYWKGAIAVVAFLVLALGGVLAAHLMGGH